MASNSVVRVRIPPLLDTSTYISLVVMSLLAIRGLHTVQTQLILLALCALVGLVYRFLFRTGLYEKNPTIYFGSQFIVMVLLLLVGSSSIDALNFIFLMVSLHAALALTRKAAAVWIAVYYLTVSAAVFIQSGSGGYYAAAFYFVAYVVIGFFGYILQQAELARERNQKLLDELQITQRKLQELAVVEERNRLARDLHDSVKQQVFAISMQLSAARTSMSESDKAYQSVAEAERLAQQAGAELTTLIRELRPPGLEKKALPIAVREHVEEWARQNKVEAEINLDENLSVDLQAEQVLFRVLQEAMANVARHSQASKVVVALKSEKENVTLKIEDNGIGFDTGKTVKGVGLDSMQERLAAMDGNLEVSSQESKGTRITATVRSS